MAYKTGISHKSAYNSESDAGDMSHYDPTGGLGKSYQSARSSKPKLGSAFSTSKKPMQKLKSNIKTYKKK